VLLAAGVEPPGAVQSARNPPAASLRWVERPTLIHPRWWRDPIVPAPPARSGRRIPEHHATNTLSGNGLRR